MEEYRDDLVEYKGISDYIPEVLNSKKEINLEEIIKIPDKDIEIEEILKVSIAGECTDIRVIDTPIGVSIDGLRLTGKKAIVNISFAIRIEYISKQSSNKIYTLKANKRMITSVILEKEEYIKRVNIASVFIEDILAKRMGKQDILLIIYGIIGVE
ncbi:MAG: hypothetical protein ACRDA3_07960 [Peptostreptococcaceae bacterium]